MLISTVVKRRRLRDACSPWFDFVLIMYIGGGARALGLIFLFAFFGSFRGNAKGVVRGDARGTKTRLIWGEVKRET